MNHCRHPHSTTPCLCAWPGITPIEYTGLLEARRTAHVTAYRAGANMSTDPGAAHRMADYLQDAPAHHFWAEGDPQPTITRTPAETPDQRAARIRASRERRIREARDRMDAYERTHPINEHGVHTGPSVASNNWRHRHAAVDRELAAWRQYQEDIKTIRHLNAIQETTS